MRTIAMALWPLDPHPETTPPLDVSVYLGQAGLPFLADLTDGERVRVIEADGDEDLMVEGVARLVEEQGQRFWYAEIGHQDIQSLPPGTIAPAKTTVSL